MKFHMEEKKEREENVLVWNQLNMTKWLKCSFHCHILNFNGLHEVLVNAMHNMGSSDILT